MIDTKFTASEIVRAMTPAKLTMAQEEYLKHVAEIVIDNQLRKAKEKSDSNESESIDKFYLDTSGGLAVIRCPHCDSWDRGLEGANAGVYECEECGNKAELTSEVSIKGLLDGEV